MYRAYQDTILMDTQWSASTPCTSCPECSPQSLHDGVTCTTPECQFLCPHMYTCDKKCYNFNNEHICKHIHKVHSLVVRNRKEAERYTESKSSTTMTQESEAPPWHGKHGGYQYWWNWDCIRKINFQFREMFVTIKYYSSNSNPPWIWTPLFKCIPRYLNTQIWNNITAVSIYNYSLQSNAMQTHLSPSLCHVESCAARAYW